MSDFRREREAIRWIVDEELYKFLTTIKATIAGGCITSIFTGAPIADIDIFFRNEGDYNKAKEYFLACEKSLYNGTKSIYETDRAKTFSMDHNKKYSPDLCGYGMSFHRKDSDNKEVIIQLVNNDVTCGEPEDIINSFDLTVCQALFDFSTEQFVFGARFFQDLARRRIVINAECKNVIGSFYRVQKYIDKGYSITPREYLKLAFMLSSKKYKTNRDFVEDMKICFADPLIHHFYNKVRYPMGTRCPEKNSLLDNPFIPEVIVEWVEEFNVAGPHYPVKEGKDMLESQNTQWKSPMIDDNGNLVKKSDLTNIFDDELLSQNSKAVAKIAFSHAPGLAPQKAYDESDDDFIDNFDPQFI